MVAAIDTGNKSLKRIKKFFEGKDNSETLKALHVLSSHHQNRAKSLENSANVTGQTNKILFQKNGFTYKTGRDRNGKEIKYLRSRYEKITGGTKEYY